jgi:1-deoxy-D-xylulose-5-phosphate synthase
MKTDYLAHINSPADLKKLLPNQLPDLAQELRDFIIDVVATKEGHLGASLGVVELTIALHYVFDTPNDLLIWDVGHQAYGHKILTDRKAIFNTNRQLNGISGFPKRAESIYDAFGTGHSSTSISAALGMAIASQLKGENRQHIAVIGDASISSGMAFEALNHAGDTNANLLVILNDNAIGIDPSVGALKNYFAKVKNRENLADNNIIKSLNFHYAGPIEGHNIFEIVNHLNDLQHIKGPKLLHLVTTKGKGLQKAEENQVVYHAPGKFDKTTGELAPKTHLSEAPKYQDIFGATLLELAKNNEKIVAITPAMPSGSGLNNMMDAYPKRVFDVGIAEQHAVTFAAGMSTQGFIAFCVIYATFLQRAYDQVIHDVALQNLPVVFCIDRAGLVGEDGATHHGVFDIAFFNAIPNMMLFAPKDSIELRNILYTAQLGLNHPIAIRYPRGKSTILDWQQPFEKIAIGKAKLLKKGSKIAVLSTGTIAHEAALAFEMIENASLFAHYHFGFIKPLDENVLYEIFETFDHIITLEEGVISGGFGSAIGLFALQNNYKGNIKIVGIPDVFIEQGTVDELKKQCGIAPENLALLFSSY